jgi:hypothetical protein
MEDQTKITESLHPQTEREPDNRKIKIRRVDGSEFVRMVTVPRDSGFDHWQADPDKNEFEVDALTAFAATACLNCNQPPSVHAGGACPDGRIPRFGFEEVSDSQTKLKGSKTAKPAKE